MNEFIIGREAGVPKEQARLAILVDGKTFHLGAKGSVPANVSKQHCRITFDANNQMTVENITENNLLYINSEDCRRKEHVSITDRIELGPGKFHLDMEAIVKALSSNQAFSIKHLEAVFENYQKETTKLQFWQGRISVLSSIPMALTMGAGLLAFNPNYSDTVKKVLGAIAFTLLVVSLVIRALMVKSIPLKRKKLEDMYRREYVCPNPACNHFLGMTTYKELIKYRSCPYCKCKFKE